MPHHRSFILCVLILAACTRSEPQPYPTMICLISPAVPTRASDPDETRISDYNLLIFNAFGYLEEKVYVPARSLNAPTGRVSYTTRLLQDVPYTFVAAANLGYELPVHTLEEARAYRYHLAYPDEYSQGIPMAAVLEEKVVGSSGEVVIPLERLMARVDLNIDRRALKADVSFKVNSVMVGGCPSSVLLIGPSKAESATQVFTVGYNKSGWEVSALNRDASVGLSETVRLYLLENCQGNLLEHVETDRGKVFTDGRYQDVCSYLEIRAEYHSDSWHSRPGESLIYRFYLGENRNNFDVRRNTLYHITVRPEGDGLQENSWRVDQSGLEPQTRFLLHPAAYNECRSGEDFHLWCEILPEGTPLYIEPLAYDDDERVADLYDYTVDPDGYGLTIHTKKGGSAVVYFSAGPPVNRDTLAMLVVDP